MKSIEEYASRDYVKSIRIGNIIYFIGLFFVFWIIGTVISFTASCQHNADSKKRIKETKQELEEKYSLSYTPGFKGINVVDLFVYSLLIVGTIFLAFKYTEVWCG